MNAISQAMAGRSFETAERILQEKMKPARLTTVIENKTHRNASEASDAIIQQIREQSSPSTR